MRVPATVVATVASTLGVLLGATSVAAHPAIHEQEEKVERALAERPDDVELHLQRGHVLAKKRDWDGALAAFDHAAKLGADPDEITLLRATAYLKAGWPEMAKLRFEALIERDPKRADATLGRGRAWMALDHPKLAAADFERAFDGIARPTPAHILEWQRALVAAGQKPEALAALDRGVARIGPVPGIVLASVDLATELGDPDGALRRLDLLLARTPDHPAWLARRGEILEVAGRSDEARSAYERALSALQARSGTRRSTRFVELEQQLRSQLAANTNDDQ